MNKQNKLREVTPEQLTFLQLKLNWSDPKVRLILAMNGMALNILVNDTNYRVRQAVAFQYYSLHQLVNDTDERVSKLAKWLQQDEMYDKAKKITDDMFRQAGCL